MRDIGGMWEGINWLQLFLEQSSITGLPYQINSFTPLVDYAKDKLAENYEVMNGKISRELFM